jgi:internalin A
VLDDLTILTELSSLKCLWNDQDPTDKPVDLTPITALKNLEVIRLYGAPVSDLSPLAGLNKLVHLDVSGSNSVRDISPLIGLDTLEELLVAGNPIGDIAPLAALAKLEVIDLSGTNVTDLRPLAGLENLTDLYLMNTGVENLTPLHSCKNLKTLDIYETRVTDAEVQRLQRVLPNCQINRAFAGRLIFVQ